LLPPSTAPIEPKQKQSDWSVQRSEHFWVP